MCCATGGSRAQGQESQAGPRGPRQDARDQACTICLPGICNRDPGTTVLCHTNYLMDGKAWA
ncbi:nuclease domain-containing protein [Massilia sp. CCM 8734]|uniref:nuclease domain-containing protein n=1 Tax=Massilia sp. CCM 8734 TaxID=2609283 RepID=UPI0034D36EE8